VLEGGDRDPDLADLPARDRRVGVVAHLGREVEGDRQSRLALVEQEPVALVRLGGGAEAGVLAHRPQARAVHGLVHAAGERILPRRLGGDPVRGQVGRAVDAPAGRAPRRGELRLPLLTAHAAALTTGCSRASSAGWCRAWSSAPRAWRTGGPGCRAARSPRRRSRAPRPRTGWRTSRGTRGSWRPGTPPGRPPRPSRGGTGC